MKSLTGFIIALMLSTQASWAQSSDLFGIANDDLARLFLEEALDIAQSGAGMRDLSGGNSLLGEDEFTILQEAYRADPDATLDLIERILTAGGRG